MTRSIRRPDLESWRASPSETRARRWRCGERCTHVASGIGSMFGSYRVRRTLHFDASEQSVSFTAVSGIGILGVRARPIRLPVERCGRPSSWPTWSVIAADGSSYCKMVGELPSSGSVHYAKGWRTRLQIASRAGFMGTNESSSPLVSSLVPSQPSSARIACL